MYLKAFPSENLYISYCPIYHEDEFAKSMFWAVHFWESAVRIKWDFAQTDRTQCLTHKKKITITVRRRIAKIFSVVQYIYSFIQWNWGRNNKDSISSSELFFSWTSHFCPWIGISVAGMDTITSGPSHNYSISGVLMLLIGRTKKFQDSWIDELAHRFKYEARGIPT